MSTVGEGVQLDGVGQVAVNVRDLGRAVAFYRDTLGIPFLFEIPGAAFFQCGGTRLMLSVAEKPELDHPASILYYRVADIRAAFAGLTAAGVRVEGRRASRACWRACRTTTCGWPFSATARTTCSR